MTPQLELCQNFGLTGNKWVWCAQEFMQRHCRPRFHAASKKDDAETADIDELAKLFAQYAQYAKALPAKPVRKPVRIKQSIEFDCAEDSDEAAANWTVGTVPMCERWFVHAPGCFVPSFELSMFSAFSSLQSSNRHILLTISCSQYPEGNCP